MIREAPAMTVRQNLGELLNEIQYRHDSVLITKGGKPVAAMVNIEMFNKIRLLEDEFERLTSSLAATNVGVDEETVQADIDEAIKTARATK